MGGGCIRDTELYNCPITCPASPCPSFLTQVSRLVAHACPSFSRPRVVDLPVASVFRYCVQLPTHVPAFPVIEYLFSSQKCFFYFPVAYSYRSSLFKISLLFCRSIQERESQKGIYNGPIARRFFSGFRKSQRKCIRIRKKRFQLISTQAKTLQFFT